jgi:hypothetical protein
VETTEHLPTSPIGADEAEFIKAAGTDDTRQVRAAHRALPP